MNDIRDCIHCPFFRDGWCSFLEEKTNADDNCNYVAAYEFMNPERAVKVLHVYQKWRRGAKVKMPMPVVIGYAIDEAIRILRKEKIK